MKKMARRLAEFETFYNLYTVVIDNPSKLPKNNSPFYFQSFIAVHPFTNEKMTGFCIAGESVPTNDSSIAVKPVFI